MRIRPHQLALLLFVAFLASCAAHQGGGETSEEEGVIMRDGATIITGVDLQDGRGTVLDAIQGKVPGMRIQHRTGQCPQISLRSHVTFQTVVNPHVYVDGTRATDTCILESLRAENVESVEIYPMGVTKRPGYGTHAHGLILVFMRTH